MCVCVCVCCSVLRGDHFPDAMCTKTIVIIIATHAYMSGGIHCSQSMML